LLAGAHVERAAARALQPEHVGVGDVADEDEVAGLQPVAEDARLLAAQQAGARDRDHARLARAVLPRAVHIPVTQRERGNARAAAKGLEVDLLGPLSRAVRGERLRGKRLPRGQRFRVPVDRAPRRRGDDSPRAGLDGRVVDRDRARDAPAHVTGRVTRGDLHAALRGEVEQRVGLEVRDRARGLFGAAVGVERLRRRRLGARVRHVVDDEHLRAGRHEALDGVGADEARAARNDNLLHSTSMTGRRSGFSTSRYATRPASAWGTVDVARTSTVTRIASCEPIPKGSVEMMPATCDVVEPATACVTGTMCPSASSTSQTCTPPHTKMISVRNDVHARTNGERMSRRICSSITCAPSANRPSGPRRTFAIAQRSRLGGSSSTKMGESVAAARPTATPAHPITPWRGSSISRSETAASMPRLYTRSNVTTAAPTRTGTPLLDRQR